MALTRGNVDTVDQTQVRLLSGRSHATQIVTTDNGTKTPGNGGEWDSFGNWIDSGSSAGSSGGTWITETPAGTLNGTNVAFTLSHTPVTGGPFFFHLNGNRQELTRWVTITGTTITMNVAPISIDRLSATYLY